MAASLFAHFLAHISASVNAGGAQVDKDAMCWTSRPGLGPIQNLRRTFHEAAARVGLPAIRPNLGLRASHATLLMARGHSYEYVRLVLGHIGEVRADQVGDHLRARAANPTTLSSHYLRSSPDTLRPR